MIDLDTIVVAYPSRLQQFRRALLREYLQYKILELIFNSEYRNKLVFIGGTALRIVHGISRFSEDLDFDNLGLTGGEFEAMAQTVRDGLEREGYLDKKLPIKIHIIDQAYHYTPEQRLINRLGVFTTVAVPPLSLLLSQKIAAALDRKRAQGRDFFDIVDLVSRAKPDYEYLQQKLGITDSKALRTALIERSSSLDFSELARGVIPFLFRPEDAKRIELFPEFIREAEL